MAALLIIIGIIAILIWWGVRAESRENSKQQTGISHSELNKFKHQSQQMYDAMSFEQKTNVAKSAARSNLYAWEQELVRARQGLSKQSVADLEMAIFHAKEFISTPNHILEKEFKNNMK